MLLTVCIISNLKMFVIVYNFTFNSTDDILFNYKIISLIVRKLIFKIYIDFVRYCTGVGLLRTFAVTLKFVIVLLQCV